MRNGRSQRKDKSGIYILALRVLCTLRKLCPLRCLCCDGWKLIFSGVYTGQLSTPFELLMPTPVLDDTPSHHLPSHLEN